MTRTRPHYYREKWQIGLFISNVNRTWPKPAQLPRTQDWVSFSILDSVLLLPRLGNVMIENHQLFFAINS
jgi:hypothetical protein